MKKLKDFVKGVSLATPCFRGELTQPYYVSCHDTMVKLAEADVPVVHSIYAGESMVHVARNILISQFMANPDLSHIFFVDNDIQWRGEDFLRLLAWTEDPEVGIVCCAYPKKTMPIRFACNLPPVEKRKGDLAAIHDAPTGFMCIRRDIIQRLMDAHPGAKCFLQDGAPPEHQRYEYALFDSLIDPATRHYLREDFCFTRRVQQLGETVWVDPKVWLGHHGQHCFFGSLEHYYQTLPEELRASVTGPPKSETKPQDDASNKA